MTDYKQLCAELVAAWDDLPWQYNWRGDLTGIDGYPPDDSAVERARAALAEPEPPSLKEQALAALQEAAYMADDSPPQGICSDQIDIIRRALESLP